MLQQLWDYLASNQFAGGGIITVVLGAIIAYCRSVPSKLYGWFLHFCTLELDIYNSTDAFTCIEFWLAKNDYTSRCRRLLFTQKWKGDDQENILLPDHSLHWFWYKRKLIWITRTMESKQTFDKSQVLEKYSIRIFGRNRKIIEKLLKEAEEAARPEDSELLHVYKWGDNYWSELGTKSPRKAASVITEGDLVEDMIDKIRKFEKKKNWFAERGLPYHLNFLLEGPPGNGKTSAIMAIASELKRDLYTINLSGASLGEKGLTTAVGTMPSKAILIAEDIDNGEALHSRAIPESKKKTVLSRPLDLATVLNCLDGLCCPDGLISILTTNHKEKLDAALIRKGRIDHCYSFPNATKDVARRIFLRFFDECPDKFLEQIDGSFNIASITAHLLNHSDDMEAAVSTSISK